MLDANVRREPISIVANTFDPEMTAIRAVIARSVAIDGPDDLARELLALAARRLPAVERSLDLIAHTTSAGSLRFGTWTIDMRDTGVHAWWRALADMGVLARVGITAVRLLGCLTADSDEAAGNVCALADVLGTRVFGAVDLLSTTYYKADGFAYERRYLLLSDRELRPQLSLAV